MLLSKALNSPSAPPDQRRTSFRTKHHGICEGNSKLLIFPKYPKIDHLLNLLKTYV